MILDKYIIKNVSDEVYNCYDCIIYKNKYFCEEHTIKFILFSAISIKLIKWKN